MRPFYLQNYRGITTADSGFQNNASIACFPNASDDSLAFAKLEVSQTF